MQHIIINQKQKQQKKRNRKIIKQSNTVQPVPTFTSTGTVSLFLMLILFTLALHMICILALVTECICIFYQTMIIQGCKHILVVIFICLWTKENVIFAGTLWGCLRLGHYKVVSYLYYCFQMLLFTVIDNGKFYLLRGELLHFLYYSPGGYCISVVVMMIR